MRIRRIDLTFTALLLPLDILALYGAGTGAYLLRFSRFVTEVRPVLQGVPFAEYVQTVTLFVGVWIVLFALAGLYSTRPRKAWNEFGRVALACTAGTMILIATVFFARELITSRFIVIAVWIFSIVFVMVERLFLRAFRHTLLRARIGHKFVVVIGASRAADQIVKAYEERTILGFTVVKRFATWSDETRKAIDKIRRSRVLDIILLADPDLPKERALDLIAYTEERHLTLHYLADLFAAAFTNIEVSTATGVPVIEVKRTPLDGWGRIFKRLFDIVVSILFLIILSPIMILTALAIKLTSRGPVFYRLDNDAPPERVGERGKTFRYIKFRSMYPHTHMMRYKELAHLDTRKGPLVKIKNDPRITPVGRFIRSWSVDELPELFLVVAGHMSLVGPRPHLPEEVERYKPTHRRVLAIRPGITGLAQISGRSDLDFDDEVRLDAWYIENWSLFLDLYILLKTPFAVLYRRKAE